MTVNPLKSLADYSHFMVECTNRPSVTHSTVSIWSDSPYTGVAEGDIFLQGNYRLHIREELDFDECIITSYGYEVYHNGERIYWYDDFPHPNDPHLASTHPHHKHLPPNIKHNRIPAPCISFYRGNIPVLIQEIEDELN